MRLSASGVFAIERERGAVHLSYQGSLMNVKVKILKTVKVNFKPSIMQPSDNVWRIYLC